MINFSKQACDFCGFEGSIAELIRMKGDVELLESPYGKTHTHSDGEHSAEVAENLQKTTIYMETQVYQEDQYASVRSISENMDRNCAYWKAIRECEARSTYMLQCCALT